jgi:hypothetical protein
LHTAEVVALALRQGQTSLVLPEKEGMEKNKSLTNE